MTLLTCKIMIENVIKCIILGTLQTGSKMYPSLPVDDCTSFPKQGPMGRAFASP